MKKLSMLLSILVIVCIMCACGVDKDNNTSVQGNSSVSTTQNDDESDNNVSDSSVEKTDDESMKENTEDDSSISNSNAESTGDNTVESTPSSEVINKRELNERLCCPGCWRGIGTLADTDVLYETYDKLVCCYCGKVEDEDYKGIYILPE